MWEGARERDRGKGTGERGKGAREKGKGDRKKRIEKRIEKTK
jgi:hypothetical protein